MSAPRERWTLALYRDQAAAAVETWLQVAMPIDLRLARAKERGVCCLVAEVSVNDSEAISFLAEIVRRTSCRVHRKYI